MVTKFILIAYTPSTTVKPRLEQGKQQTLYPENMFKKIVFTFS